LKIGENEFLASQKTQEHVKMIRQRLASGHSLRAGVVGAGTSGQAAFALLKEHDFDVEFFDDSTSDRNIEAANLESLDLIVLSPGVPRKLPALSEAIKQGKLVGEIELASWFTDIPLIGITGTNGKSTTTALVGHIFDVAGVKAFVGGNLGRPFSELTLCSEKYESAVIELSSYQLESLVDSEFDVVCFLNLTEDHTDRYESINSYANAKSSLVSRRTKDGLSILNADDDFCRDLGAKSEAPIRWFSSEEDTPHVGELGCHIDSKNQAIRRWNDGIEVYSLGNARLLGQHNRSNMLAAIECARRMGISVESVQEGLSSFQGLEHRIELVGTYDGVRWYNDSKATNVESALTALRAMDAPVILIAGGTDKGGSWAPMLDYAKNLKAVLAIGDATAIVLDAFAGRVTLLESCGKLETAVFRAREIAEANDIVLLSPACASFDQFENYAHRGNVFRQLVLELERGACA
jgi:UDP-N-acetylmuramoylalanine--D-glutamate ligase